MSFSVPCATLTASAFVPQPGATAATTAPCLVHSIVITAPTDDVVVSVYDLAELQNSAVPSGTLTILDRVIVAAGTTESFYLSVMAKKGVYLQIVSGTSPRVTVYVA